jgi:hypothetical protein
VFNGEIFERLKKKKINYPLGLPAVRVATFSRAHFSCTKVFFIKAPFSINLVYG